MNLLIFFTALFFLLFPVRGADAHSRPYRPVVLLVPGAFHSAEVYYKVVNLLKQVEYDVVEPIGLPSVGHPVGRDSDIDAVVLELGKYIDAGRDVVLVGNSYGCTVIGEAVKGFPAYPQTTTPRAVRRNSPPTKGRVLGLIYLAGYIPYISEITNPSERPDIRTIAPPFFRFTSDGKVYSDGDLANFPSQQTFYNMLPAQEADYWASKLDYSSFNALNATAGYVPYTGDFRVVYVAGEQDRTVTPEFAQSYIGQEGARFVVEWLDVDHVPMLSRAAEVVGVIRKYAENRGAW